MNTMRSKANPEDYPALAYFTRKKTQPEVSAKTSKGFSEIKMHRHGGTLEPLLSHLYHGPVTKPVSIE